MIKLLRALPQYPIARLIDGVVPLPINLTIGISYICQSRCASCRVYKREPVNEMTTEEWGKVFQNIGDNLYWTTISGGEPFLREDIVEIYYLLNKYCKPKIVNIPTNGLLTDRIVDKVWQMAKMFPDTQLVINVSIDHNVDTLNDYIRGVKGYYDKAVATVKGLQEIKAENLKVGIHSVISQYNVKSIRSIAYGLRELLKDKSHYISEIAEARVELGTMDLPIAPSREDYAKAVEVLKELANEQKHSVIQSFRKNYYDRVNKWLVTKKNIPCYAGYASCQITPDGYVNQCCIRYDVMGNLRTYEYDFNKLWNSKRANEVRQGVKHCVKKCPLANASYTNSLLHIPTMARVVRGLL